MYKRQSEDEEEEPSRRRGSILSLPLHWQDGKAQNVQALWTIKFQTACKIKRVLEGLLLSVWALGCGACSFRVSDRLGEHSVCTLLARSWFFSGQESRPSTAAAWPALFYTRVRPLVLFNKLLQKAYRSPSHHEPPSVQHYVIKSFFFLFTAVTSTFLRLTVLIYFSFLPYV